MAQVSLTQAEADALVRIEKHRVDQQVRPFPERGQSMTVPLQSVDKRESFLVDINRGRIELRKVTYQCRARQIFILVRIDLAGRPHRNPDDEEIPCPHMHVYREDFGDRWATRLPDEYFSDVNDMWGILNGFYQYCNVTLPPKIERGLWS